MSGDAVSTQLDPSRAMRPGGRRLVPDPTVVFMSDFVRPWVPGEGADVALLGIPFDGAVSLRPGARFGPEAVREALRTSTTYSVASDVDIAVLRVVDCGDVVVSNDLARTHAAVEAVVDALLRARLRPIAIGGDHSATAPCLRALAGQGGRVGLVHFDAHFDARRAPPGQEHSGVWLREVLDGGVVQGRDVLQVGIGDFAYSRDYVRDLRGRGVTIRTARDIRAGGMLPALGAFMASVAGRIDALYVSVDIDSIHQGFAPGTSVPNPDGLMPWDVMDGLEHLAAEPSFVMMDVVEIAPVLDPGATTAGLGAELIRRALCGIAAAVPVRPVVPGRPFAGGPPAEEATR